MRRRIPADYVQFLPEVPADYVQFLLEVPADYVQILSKVPADYVQIASLMIKNERAGACGFFCLKVAHFAACVHESLKPLLRCV